MQRFQYIRHKEKELLIDFLFRRFPYLTREKWVENIQLAAIKINDQPVTPTTVLNNNDIISYLRPREDEPEIDTRYNILYLDDSIVVVEKNGNIPISESGKYYQNTLLNILKEGEGFSELYAVHRLDRETSGIVVIGRTKEIATTMGEQFQRRVPQKEYHAVLLGEFPEKELMVNFPIRKVRASEINASKYSVRIRQLAAEDGKESKTLFIAEKVANGLTLAKIKLFTGRTHQIRCHSEYAGFPVLGDKLYGQSDETFIQIMKGEREPVFAPYGKVDRQLLHASYLSFQHPKTGKEMVFRSNFQDEFLAYPFLKELCA